jgi:hypothetical protein
MNKCIQRTFLVYHNTLLIDQYYAPYQQIFAKIISDIFSGTIIIINYMGIHYLPHYYLHHIQQLQQL